MLDWLAQDLVAHHYDLRETMARILTSRAYQLPAADSGEQKQTNFVFTGPEIRRLTAEQFRDALTSLTGVGYSLARAEVDLDEDVKEKFGPKLEAQWIWNSPGAERDAKVGAIYLRKTVHLDAMPYEADALVYCDNSFEMYVNGHKAGEGADYAKPFMVDFTMWLKPGDNLIAMMASNGPANPPNPAGLFIYARVRAGLHGKERVMDFVSDRSWMVTDQRATNWEQSGFEAKDWTAASELGAINIPGWGLPEDTVARQFASRSQCKVRSSLVAADPLMVALGRPNREQVVTTRDATATTLQALELTNGKTLATVLDKGAANLIQQNESGSKLVRSIYMEAMGRNPTRGELKLAEGVVGAKPTQEGVEDFLWAVAMLPEFQLIY
jgi:hypothetical protein